MKQLWQIVTQANTAEEARSATYSVHARKNVSWVQDTFESVLRGVEAKRVRAEENPALYSDKLVEYDEIEHQLYALVDSEEPPTVRLIEALRIAQDARLADSNRACAVWVSGDRWIVFGAVL